VGQGAKEGTDGLGSSCKPVITHLASRLMAELDLTSRVKGKGAYGVIVTNLGPDTVILSKIEGAEGDDSFFVGPPLHRNDLELIRGERHQFMVAPSLADRLPLEVDITFIDDTGERKKTYPIYI